MKEQYRERISRLQEHLKKEELDAMLVSSQDAIYYLSGASYMPLERPFLIVVRPDGAPDLLVPELEREHMNKVEGFGTISSYFEYPSVSGENWYDKLAQLTGEDIILAVEPSLTLEKAALLRVKDKRVTDFIDRMRTVKSPAEIEAIRLAARWTDLGMKRTHRGLYRGQCVLETNMPSKKLQTGVIASTDFDYFNCSFLTAGWPAPKSAQPHSLPDLRTPMGDGPIVLMSFNRVNGYAAECERTVFLGGPTDSERELFNHMMKAREIAYSMVKPGASCSDIDMATRNYFASVGLGDKILHRTGHGIGMGNHEQPWISAGSGDILEENMVISVEPGIYLPDVGGFRHSDTVLVTADGFERITKYPDDLESLIIRGGGLLKKIKGKIIRSAVKY